MSIAEAELGAAYATALATLIADAQASDTAAALLLLYEGQATVKIDDSLVITIGTSCTVSFAATGNRIRRDNRGRVDWNSVRRLRLDAIDRH